MHTPEKPTLALIAGPTASGKSALAIELAERVGGVVINADASQVYQDLRVVTARPSPLDEARAPHRLFGYVDGAQAWSAARWAADAAVEVDRAIAHRRVPILVGGTGLYLRTLLEGIAPVPDIDPAVRDAVRKYPVADAYEALTNEDPDAAVRLNRQDTTRVARALEVVRSTGRPLAAWQAERVGGIAARFEVRGLVLLPERATLIARCDARLEAMFAQGAVEEVAALLARGDIPDDAPVRRAIGVPDIAAMLAGTISRADALAAAQHATRRYAKRQGTWFRNQMPREWQCCTAVDLQLYFADMC